MLYPDINSQKRSKKVSAAQREAENAPHRIWKTAIYARLSDFDDVLRDMESLEVQISYIKEYINHRDDLMLLDVFADKRCTGMNFDRPEFERLLKALQERKVNCIVVKDYCAIIGLNQKDLENQGILA